jgi:hypothetical protein
MPVGHAYTPIRRRHIARHHERSVSDEATLAETFNEVVVQAFVKPHGEAAIHELAVHVTPAYAAAS